MVKPNVYVLGGKPELVIEAIDTDGNYFIPTESRLSIEKPDGTVVTVSGADMTDNTTYLSYLYSPAAIGYYSYEVWIKDSEGREATGQNGFHVVDRVDN